MNASGESEIEISKTLKLTILVRRFWPSSSAAEHHVRDLAIELTGLGHQVEILTVRWDRAWPAAFLFQGVQVHRLSRPTSGPWGNYRYLKGLTRHLKASPPDGLILFGLGEGVCTVIKSMARAVPCIIRIDDSLLEDAPVAAALNARQMQTLGGAAAVFVESEWTQRRLELHKHSDGGCFKTVPMRPRERTSVYRDQRTKKMARRAFVDAHPMLQVQPNQPLAICGAPQNGDSGILDLVEAWQQVIRNLPQAKLWLYGLGTAGREIWDAVVEYRLRESVVMPGQFEDLEDVFQAADLYIHPLRSPLACSMLPRAMQASVCPLVTESIASLHGIEHEHNGLVVPIAAPLLLSRSITMALENPVETEAMGASCGRHYHATLNPISEALQVVDVVAKTQRPITMAVDNLKR